MTSSAALESGAVTIPKPTTKASNVIPTTIHLAFRLIAFLLFLRLSGDKPYRSTG
jgi:hypothetical protein